MELYISVGDQIQAKAKSAPFNYDESFLARYQAAFEDKLFTRDYEHLQAELMRWQVQRWLWDFLFPEEKEGFPGVMPKPSSVVHSEDSHSKVQSVKIRKDQNKRKTSTATTAATGQEIQRIKKEEPCCNAKIDMIEDIATAASCARCGSKCHQEAQCTSHVIHERVLGCSISVHGLYIFGKGDGCPKCLQN